MKKLAVLVLAITVLLVSVGMNQMFAAPGDSSDPVITLSYIESVLMTNVKKVIDEQLAKTQETSTFQVVTVAKGHTLLGEAGTELILRMGKAKIVSTPKGGIANVTSGVDLANGTDVPPNSLLIVPLGDGRGMEILEDVIVMVKGNYSVK